MYSPLRARWMICCCVEGLQVPVCWQFADEMMMGTPLSNTGTDLCFPAEDPDNTSRKVFWVDLILMCHLQSFASDPDA